jgi:hypothetical protein
MANESVLFHGKLVMTSQPLDQSPDPQRRYVNSTDRNESRNEKYHKQENDIKDPCENKIDHGHHLLFDIQQAIEQIACQSFQFRPEFWISLFIIVG